MTSLDVSRYVVIDENSETPKNVSKIVVDVIRLIGVHQKWKRGNCFPKLKSQSYSHNFNWRFSDLLLVMPVIPRLFFARSSLDINSRSSGGIQIGSRKIIRTRIQNVNLIGWSPINKHASTQNCVSQRKIHASTGRRRRIIAFPLRKNIAIAIDIILHTKNLHTDLQFETYLPPWYFTDSKQFSLHR